MSPAPLMQLATAFWAFGTLAAAVELDLFSKISGAGTNADELITLLDLPSRPAEVLLNGCAGLGLLQKRDGRFHNTPLADEYLVRGKPYYFGGFVAMNFQQSYLPWHPVVEALKSDRRVWFEDQTRDWAQTVAQNAHPARNRGLSEWLSNFSSVHYARDTPVDMGSTAELHRRPVSEDFPMPF